MLHKALEKPSAPLRAGSALIAQCAPRTTLRAPPRAHHSARTAPRSLLRARHRSARTAQCAQLRSHSSAAGCSSASAGVLATGPRPHVPPAARMRVGEKAPPLISPLTNPLPPPSISSGRVGGRKEMQLRVPAVPCPVQLARLALRPPSRPAPAACCQWSGRRTAARRPCPRPAGPARGCRPGPRLPALPVY